MEERVRDTGLPTSSSALISNLILPHPHSRSSPSPLIRPSRRQITYPRPTESGHARHHAAALGARWTGSARLFVIAAITAAASTPITLRSAVGKTTSGMTGTFKRTGWTSTISSLRLSLCQS